MLLKEEEADFEKEFGKRAEKRQAKETEKRE